MIQVNIVPDALELFRSRIPLHVNDTLVKTFQGVAKHTVIPEGYAYGFTKYPNKGQEKVVKAGIFCGKDLQCMSYRQRMIKPAPSLAIPIHRKVILFVWPVPLVININIVLLGYQLPESIYGHMQAGGDREA